MPRNFSFFVLLFIASATFSQEIPMQRNMLATFGNMAGVDCVDDDFSQVVFLALPAKHAGDLYIRVYDPDCGGMLDRPTGLWETNTIFTVLGGDGTITAKGARGGSAGGNNLSGTVLQREIFADESEIDGKWVTFGPFSPAGGEQVDAWPGYVFFKLLVEGHTGDDGNVYGLFLSSQPHQNSAIPHAAFFTYERIDAEGDDLRTIRADARFMNTDEVILPLQLDELPQEPAYHIIAEPVDD